MSGCWIWFRYDFWSKDIAERITFFLVLQLVFGLAVSLVLHCEKADLAYPVLLEAILRTKVAFNTHLLTRRTLETTGWVWTVLA